MDMIQNLLIFSILREIDYVRMKCLRLISSWLKSWNQMVLACNNSTYRKRCQISTFRALSGVQRSEGVITVDKACAQDRFLPQSR
jgi:hypothetical protein